eukprot:scaffold464_cov244-Pinguiococcus_pyrenoidosus.AAC.1
MEYGLAAAPAQTTNPRTGAVEATWKFWGLLLIFGLVDHYSSRTPAQARAAASGQRLSGGTYS